MLYLQQETLLTQPCAGTTVQIRPPRRASHNNLDSVMWLVCMYLSWDQIRFDHMSHHCTQACHGHGHSCFSREDCFTFHNL